MFSIVIFLSKNDMSLTVIVTSLYNNGKLIILFQSLYSRNMERTYKIIFYRFIKYVTADYDVTHMSILYSVLTEKLLFTSRKKPPRINVKEIFSSYRRKNCSLSQLSIFFSDFKIFDSPQRRDFCI